MVTDPEKDRTHNILKLLYTAEDVWELSDIDQVSLEGLEKNADYLRLVTKLLKGFYENPRKSVPRFGEIQDILDNLNKNLPEWEDPFNQLNEKFYKYGGPFLEVFGEERYAEIDSAIKYARKSLNEYNETSAKFEKDKEELIRNSVIEYINYYKGMSVCSERRTRAMILQIGHLVEGTETGYRVNPLFKDMASEIYNFLEGKL